MATASQPEKRPAAAEEDEESARDSRDGRALNVLLVSHCNFTGNSALHVLAVARQVEAVGWTPAIAVPDRPRTVGDLGAPAFPVLTYENVRRGNHVFPDGRGPDLVHAFTPRELVREVTQAVVARYGCPYLVHLEDNEELILADELGHSANEVIRDLPAPLADSLVQPWRSHPVRSREFMNLAAGTTVLLDKLLDFAPQGTPAVVFWPGFDEDLASRECERASSRARLGLDDEDIVLAYTGNIHSSNLEEVRSLYVAVAVLRRQNERVVLLKTGWNHVPMDWTKSLGGDEAFLDLGFVNRRELVDVMAAADILVQPGSAGPFNDYRFPSKLPDFLASGKPVILPATNIGAYLRDGQEAIVLQRADATEIANAVKTLAHDPALRSRLGDGGRAFALRKLRWSSNVAPVLDLYSAVAEASGRLQGSFRFGAAETNTGAAPPVKLIAFYLPQFHPIPENDEWWGTGFTEWTNVRSGTPQYAGHQQPQVPGDLGYYDLRDPCVMDTQARLAREYGIYGFCLYYYWFDGRRVLDRPLNDLLASDSPGLPFCLCWANENWTRRWDGLDDEVLLRQEYPPGWAERFIDDLLPAIVDPRYIRVDEAPLLLVYRADLVPDVQRVAEFWRSLVLARTGSPLHLAAVQSFGIDDPRSYGFDSAVEFPPHTQRFLVNHRDVPGVDHAFDGYFEDYPSVMRHQLGRQLPDYSWYRGVMPSWDNTARRGHRAHILINASPSNYELWLRKLVLQALCRSPVEEPFIFVNAWNEWAEGTHLEPDEHLGRQWLEATAAALRDGVRQFYASRGSQLSTTDARDFLQRVLPPLEP